MREPIEVTFRPGRWRTERGQKHRDKLLAISFVTALAIILSWVIIGINAKSEAALLLMMLITLLLIVGAFMWGKKWTARIERKWGHMPLTSQLHPDDQPEEWNRPREHKPHYKRHEHRRSDKRSHKQFSHKSSRGMPNSKLALLVFAGIVIGCLVTYFILKGDDTSTERVVTPTPSRPTPSQPVVLDESATTCERLCHSKGFDPSRAEQYSPTECVCGGILFAIPQ